MEYVEQQTREAKFVRALDKLEANIHETIKGTEYLTSTDFVAKYPNNAVKNFPELIPFLKELQAYMKQKFKEAGHEWKEEFDV